jgi:hypothetical protein
LLLDRIAEVQQSDETLAVRQADRVPSGLLAQDARGSPVAGQPVGVCSEQHDVAGNRGGVKVLLILLGVAGQRTGGDDQGRSTIELRRCFRPGRLLEPLQRRWAEDAEAPRRGEVVIGRPAGQLEQIVDLLAGNRLRLEGLVGATGADRGLDVDAGTVSAPPRRRSLACLREASRGKPATAKHDDRGREADPDRHQRR